MSNVPLPTTNVRCNLYLQMLPSVYRTRYRYTTMGHPQVRDGALIFQTKETDSGFVTHHVVPLCNLEEASWELVSL